MGRPDSARWFQKEFKASDRMEINSKAGGLLATAVLLVAGATFFSVPDSFRVAPAALVLFILAMFLLFLASGMQRQGHAASILIDARNRMSLSRLITICWTCLIGGTYAVLVMLRIGTGSPDPTNIDIDRNLVELMGLTVAGLGTSAVIQKYKGSSGTRMSEAERDAHRMSTLRWNAPKLIKEFNEAHAATRPNPLTQADVAPLLAPLVALDKKNRAKTFAKVESAAQTPQSKEFVEWYKDHFDRSPPLGTLVRNPEPKYARFADMTQAEEVGSSHRADLGKLQLAILNAVLMFMFLLAAFLPLTDPIQAVCADAEGAALSTLDDTTCLGLPTLTGGMVGILMASQGGYLLNKGAGNPIDRWTKEDQDLLGPDGPGLPGGPSVPGPSATEVASTAATAASKAAASKANKATARASKGAKGALDGS